MTGSFNMFSRIPTLLSTSLLGLTIGAGVILSSTLKAQEPYIQGGIGLGLIGDYEVRSDAALEALDTFDPVPVLSFEGGVDGLGIDNIRAGISYQTYDFNQNDDDNTTVNSLPNEIELVGANIYYVGNEIIAQGMVVPYVGGGVVLASPAGFDAEVTYAFHAGAEIPYTEKISVGTKYTYLGEAEYSEGDGTTVEMEGQHLLSATMTYKFTGGMEKQQAMRSRSVAMPNARMRPQSTMTQSSRVSMGNTQAGGTRGYGQARYQRNY